MTACSETHRVDVDEPDARCRQAADTLREDGARVLFGDAIRLRRHGRRIVCEVIEPPGSMHRCAEEYAVLVENARRVEQAEDVIAQVARAVVEHWNAPD